MALNISAKERLLNYARKQDEQQIPDDSEPSQSHNSSISMNSPGRDHSMENPEALKMKIVLQSKQSESQTDLSENEYVPNVNIKQRILVADDMNYNLVTLKYFLHRQLDMS